jgi:PKD repeat protein|tara:strand:+ start:252 stop:527 length:276 start_codon:yes stop_codon:yes gene_type:complete
MILNATQTGQDGTGQTVTLTGLSKVRLKAKEVTVIRNTTLKVTGNTTATTWTIGVVVQPGGSVSEHYPPAVNIDPPLPVANFSYIVDSDGV